MSARPWGLRPATLTAREYAFDDELDTDEGWAKYNSHYWLKDYRGFLEFFFAQCVTEPHSTKQIEDCVAWALDDKPGDARRHDARARHVAQRGPARDV